VPSRGNSIRKNGFNCFSIIKIIINSIDLKAQTTLFISDLSNPMWTADRELADGSQDARSIFYIIE